MTVSFVDIEGKFDRVFGFIRRDLERILTLEEGGNFAVALLATCACETLAKYRYRSGEGADAFKTLLPQGRYQTVARTLYDVLRNGLVHRYDAADLRFDGKTVRFAIAWKKSQHLSTIEIGGIPNLIINVNDLCGSLFSAFDEYETELRNSGEARDRFFQTYRKESEKEVPDGEIDAWRNILKQSE